MSVNNNKKLVNKNFTANITFQLLTKINYVYICLNGIIKTNVKANLLLLLLINGKSIINDSKINLKAKNINVTTVSD